MQQTSRRRLAVAGFVLTLSMLCVVAFTGPAAGQSGTVSITDEITSESQVFDVEVTSLQETQTGCLEVANLDTGTVFRRTDVGEGARFSVSREELGGLESGQGVEATLYEEPFDCFTELSRDTRTVQATAQFAVTVDETTSPVLEGERFEVNATVENTGNERDTQPVDLRVDGKRQDRLTLTLEAGESRQVELVWGTQSGDAGAYQASVASTDSDDVTSVLVEEPDPANVSVAVDETTSPVLEGERLAVTATVENTGDVTTTQTVDLRVDAALEDDRLVTLEAGASRQITLEWQTRSGDAGTHGVTVASEDDTATTNVTVAEADPATLAVELDETTSPVLAGENLDVTATVENTGEETVTQTVDLRVGTDLEDDRTVTVAGGDSRQVTLTWATQQGDAGTHGATVATDDDTTTTNVTVEAQQPGTLAVEIDETTSPVLAGDPLAVTATVENTGEETVTRTVDLRVDTFLEDDRTVTLEGGASRQLRLEWQTRAGDAGAHGTSVASGDDVASTNVSVLAAGGFELSVNATNAPVAEGNSLEVTATVRNTGTTAAAESVALRVGNRTLDTTERSLAGGEAEPVTLRWDTEPGDAGAYELELLAGDDTESVSVRVLEAVAFPVEITSTNAPVTAGDELFVTGTVTNTGAVGDTQDLVLTADGLERDARNLTLASGESREVTLSWATGDAGSGEYDLELATRSDSDTVTVALTDADCDDSLPLLLVAVLVLALVLAVAGGVALYYRRQRRPPL